ncbi:MAG: DUF222 domain-containing protein [Gammaproteobacteria bacterium]|nr:DUF222 domain-containing protein [Gammaproteobacteria bacterium]
MCEAEVHSFLSPQQADSLVRADALEREKVRAAHALKQLPLVSAAFAGGELSFSKVRALTRVADAASEAEWLHLARNATAAQLEKLVRAYRKCGRLAERENAVAQHASRDLNYYHDDDGSLVIRARLPADEGAVVLQALGAAMDARQSEAEDTSTREVTAVTSEPADTFAQRRADALAAVAEIALRSDSWSSPTGDRYQVMIHVTAESLAGNTGGRCELNDGPSLAPDTVRRIACDSSLLRLTEDRAGNPLDIGHKTRAIPPAMRRALRARDGGCRFPGCSHHRFVDAHHIRHWADGGETSIDNLLTLCRRHHGLVHEGGFGLERNADGRLRFTRPDGREISEHPRLPADDGIEALRDANRRAGQAINASGWIIPGDKLDYGIAIGGLLQASEGDERRTGV